MNDGIVIIPTYNEIENIETILRAVFSLHKSFDVLIVYAEGLASSSYDKTNKSITPFTGKNEPYNEVYGYFLETCELINLKAETTQNLLGLLGAYISNFFFNHTTGYSSIIIPFILILWSLDLFQNLEIKRQTLVKSVLLILMSITAATLMALFFEMNYIQIH
jgi:hypothetical protein